MKNFKYQLFLIVCLFLVFTFNSLIAQFDYSYWQYLDCNVGLKPLIKISPDNNIYAGGQEAFKKTDFDIISWTDILGNLPNHEIKGFDFNVNGSLFVSLYGKKTYFYRSDNAGLTYSILGDLTDYYCVGPHLIVTNYQNGNIYLGDWTLEEDYECHYLWRSTDNGNNFNILYDIFYYPGGFTRPSDIAFYNDNIFVSDNGVYFSSNGGTDWIIRGTTNGLPNTYFTALAVDTNGTIYTSSELGKVYKSTNNGFTWTEFTYHLPEQLINDLAIDGDNIYAAIQGGVYVSSLEQPFWRLLYGNAGLINTNIQSFIVKKIYGVLNIFAADEFGNIYKASSVVPVEMMNFEATSIGRRVELVWQTASEINSDRFEIERTIKGQDNDEFRKIGEVRAAGYSNNLLDYGPYIDNNVTGGKTYKYRIKQVDISGEWSYSEEREVCINGLMNNRLGLPYPNPANTYTDINYSFAGGNQAIIELYDDSGNRLRCLFDKMLTSGEEGTVRIDLKELPQGMYNIILTSGDFQYQQKIVLIK